MPQKSKAGTAEGVECRKKGMAVKLTMSPGLRAAWETEMRRVSSDELEGGKLRGWEVVRVRAVRGVEGEV